MSYWEKPEPETIVVSDDEVLRYEIDRVNDQIHELKADIQHLEDYRSKLISNGFNEVMDKELKRTMIEHNKFVSRIWKEAQH